MRFVKLLFFSSLIAFLFGLYKGDALPSPAELLPALGNEPKQKSISRPAFETTVNEIVYRVKPLHDYELWGLVFSKHYADSLIDYAHKEWGDHLNTVDLCVIWGRNAFSGIYEAMRFRSGQWTCYAQSSAAIWEQFSLNGLSNNHILTDRDAIRRMLKQVRLGDQIHFRGYLVEYSHADGFYRGTSATRDDTGDGACETVFIEEFDILQQGPRRWLVLRWVAGLALLVSVVAWWRLPDSFHAGN